MSTLPKAVSEYDAIAETIQRYVDGGKSGRSAEMKTAFHSGATIFGYTGDDLFKAFADHSSLLVDLRAEYPFAALRDDPRYKDLLKRMNLPE